MKNIVTIIIVFLMAIIVILYIGKELKVINVGTEPDSEECKEYTTESVNKDYMFGTEDGKEIPTNLKDVPVYNIGAVVNVRGVEYSDFSVKSFDDFDSIPEELKIGDYDTEYFLDVSFKMHNTNESSISACVLNYGIVCDFDDLDKSSSGQWVFRDGDCLLGPNVDIKLNEGESVEVRLIVCFIDENEWKENLINSSNISFMIDPNGVANYYKDAALIDIKDEVAKESK